MEAPSWLPLAALMVVFAWVVILVSNKRNHKLCKAISLVEALNLALHEDAESEAQETLRKQVFTAVTDYVNKVPNSAVYKANGRNT